MGDFDIINSRYSKEILNIAEAEALESISRHDIINILSIAEYEDLAWYIRTSEPTPENKKMKKFFTELKHNLNKPGSSMPPKEENHVPEWKNESSHFQL